MQYLSANRQPQWSAGYRQAIQALAFLYVASSYVLVATPGLSRLSLCVACAMAVLIFFPALLSGHSGIPRVFAAPIMFCFIVVTSVLWSTDSGRALAAAGQVVSCMLGTLCLVVALRRGMSWQTIIAAVVVGSLVLIGSTIHEVTAFGLTGRAAGLTGNANGLAIALSVAAFILLTAPYKISRVGRFFAVAFISYATIFTGSRKMLFVIAILALLSILALIRNARDHTSSKTGILFGAATLIIVILFLAGSGSPALQGPFTFVQQTEIFRRTDSALAGTNYSARIRREMFADAIQLWRAKPLFGWGINQFSVVSVYGSYSHRNYGELLADLGIVGFLAYYILHLNLAYQSWRPALAGSPHHQSALLILLLIFLLDYGMVSYYSKVSWLLLVLASDLVQPMSDARQHQSAWRIKRSGVNVPLRSHQTSSPSCRCTVLPRSFS